MPSLSWYRPCWPCVAFFTTNTASRRDRADIGPPRALVIGRKVTRRREPVGGLLGVPAPPRRALTRSSCPHRVAHLRPGDRRAGVVRVRFPFPTARARSRRPERDVDEDRPRREHPLGGRLVRAVHPRAGDSGSSASPASCASAQASCASPSPAGRQSRCASGAPARATLSVNIPGRRSPRRADRAAGRSSPFPSLPRSHRWRDREHVQPDEMTRDQRPRASSAGGAVGGASASGARAATRSLAGQ